MKKTLTLLFLALILAFFNYSIAEKEDIKNHGEIIYLMLAPVDPRSIMQGDYMRLAYDIARHIRVTDRKPSGTIVIQPDTKGVGQFVRPYNGDPLKSGEKLIPYTSQFKRPFIMPDAFFFQEGTEKQYTKAKYGIFKFKGPFERVLIGLADSSFNPLNALIEER